MSVDNICYKCGKEFKTEITLNLHMKRKSPCVNIKTKKKEINTFSELYNFLHDNKSDEILSWLEDPWVGKDKQESLFRLFGSLGLIPKLSDFEICKGNFNLQTISKMRDYSQIFYNDKSQEIFLKDKGDISDLTGISKDDEKTILACTSKNLTKENIGKMDIEKILFNFNNYKEQGYTLVLCFVVRDCKHFEKMISSIQKTNKNLSEFLKNNKYIIIDWNDLNQSFYNFKNVYKNVPINSLVNMKKQPLIFKLHQRLTISKTLKLIKDGKDRCLWGHIQRSGKSYILAGIIIKDSEDIKKCNYLIITTAPNETIEQYLKVLDCLQLSEFNVIYLHGKNSKPSLKDKNIIICSKQFLQTKVKEGEEKTKSISWLKDLNFNIRFIDESHNGGTTSLSKKTLEYYGNDSFTIQITATYRKPILDYNISKDCWILWDLEDISYCKKINNSDNREKLIQKHSPEMQNIIKEYSDQEIINEYSKYPDLYLLTDKIDSEIEKEVINQTQDNHYGWSTEACFLLKQGKIKIPEFQNEEENLKIWYRIFGKRNKFNIPDKEYPDDKVFLKRIEKICKNSEINSRFFKDDEVSVVMTFLPMNDIDNISTATKNLLEGNNVIPDYNIIIINSKITDDPKGLIQDGINQAKVTGKKGLLVLSGRQCSLGVSIQNCDIVILLNNNSAFDMIYQMMFRCMTESHGKKCGFVIDFNIKRAIDISFEYSTQVKPDLHPKEALKYVLNEKIINLNADHWLPIFGNTSKDLETLTKGLYQIYSKDTEKVLRLFLDRLKYKQILLTKDENLVFNTLFQKIKPTRQQEKLIEKILRDTKTEEIKDGIEKLKIESDDEEKDNDEEKEENKFNYMEFLKQIIPLISILTIHQDQSSLEEMFKAIESDRNLFQILIDQTKNWWGCEIDKKLVKKFITIYTKYLKDDKEIKNIIRTVKELFKKNLENSNELSKIIDEYFVPAKQEQQEFGEVSSPYNLRNDMLDTISFSFWRSPKKVLEPCSGKGGFLLDIVDRFNEGLKNTIPDDEERYRVIVEECLYFADINSTNIFICKLLLDPYDNYNLNYYTGDTLKLDISKEWSIETFDAIIGNPPYSTDPSKQDSKPLYNLFIEHLIDKCKYLLFVVPSRWFVGGKGLDKFRKMMIKRKDIRTIIHTDNSKDWFGKIVNIAGGCNYFLKDSDYKGLCKFNGVDYLLSKYDTIIKPKFHPMIDKMIKYDSIVSLYKGRFFGIETNDKRLKDTGKVKCFISYLKSKDRLKYLDKYDFNDDNTFWKVITTRTGTDKFGFTFVGKPDEIHTGSYICFKVENEEEAKSLFSYMGCKLPNYMLAIRKISQDINENVCKWIPLVPLDRIWDDKKVFEYFNIKQEELI
jgi:hypothetical protein